MSDADGWGTPESRGERANPTTQDAASRAVVPVEDPARDIALKKLKRKRDFTASLGSWLGVSALCTVIWVATGAHGYFWPIWPMVGIGIGVAAQAWAAWGPGDREITEADIEAELRRRRAS